MAEMNQYLESIDHYPGSCETQKADNSSASNNQKSPPEKLSLPPIQVKGDGTKQKPKSLNKNLVPIDEANPPGEYEYYNNITCGSGQSIAESSNFDDDSLVAMAKRMDDASIISDITAPAPETFLALPPPKKMGVTASMKKLGQKINLNQNRKSAAPQRKTPGSGVKQQPPPRPPPRNTQQLNDHQLANLQTLGLSSHSASRVLDPEAGMVTTSSRSKRDHSPSSYSGSPLSSKESTQLRPTKQFELVGKDIRRLPSSDTVNSSGCKNKTVANSSEPLCPEINTINASTQRGGRHSSPPTDTSANEEGRAGRRSRKNKNRKCPSSRNVSPSTMDGGVGLDKIPTDPMPGASAYLVGANATTSHKATTRSRGNSISRRRGRRSSKKRQEKAQDNNSSDESMQGIGFNTRISGSPKIDSNPKRTEDQIEEETMLGIGFNTRMNASPKFDHNPKIIAESMPTRPQNPSTKKSHELPQAATIEIQMDQYASLESDDHSSYDSDEQTQIFYESTDDEEFSSEEELVAVGTSVADAVKDLNDKRAVTKVKNLFGIRR